MLGINLNDLELGNNTFSDNDMETFEDTQALGDTLNNTDDPTIKQEVTLNGGKDYDPFETNLNEEYLKFKSTEVPEISKGDLLNNIPNNEKIIVGKQMTNKNTRTFSCDLCDYRTEVITRGYEHLHTVHRTTVYQCEKCDYKSVEKRNVKVHRTTQHSGLRYDCDECEFQTVHKKDLPRHKLRKHNDGTKPFSCDICTYRAVAASWVTEHKVAKHKADMLTFNCDFCSYKSITIRGVNIHIKNQHKSNIV